MLRGPAAQPPSAVAIAPNGALRLKRHGRDDIDEIYRDLAGLDNRVRRGTCRLCHLLVEGHGEAVVRCTSAMGAGEERSRVPVAAGERSPDSIRKLAGRSRAAAGSGSEGLGQLEGFGREVLCGGRTGIRAQGGVEGARRRAPESAVIV